MCPRHACGAAGTSSPGSPSRRSSLSVTALLEPPPEPRGVGCVLRWSRVPGPAVPCGSCCRPGGGARGSSGECAPSLMITCCQVDVTRLGLTSHTQLLLGRLAQVRKEHSACCVNGISEESFFCRPAQFVSQGLARVCREAWRPRAPLVLFLSLSSLLRVFCCCGILKL